MNSLSAFIHVRDSQTNFLISIESKLNFNSRLSSEQETFQNSYDTKKYNTMATFNNKFFVLWWLWCCTEIVQ